MKNSITRSAALKSYVYDACIIVISHSLVDTKSGRLASRQTRVHSIPTATGHTLTTIDLWPV